MEDMAAFLSLRLRGSGYVYTYINVLRCTWAYPCSAYPCRGIQSSRQRLCSSVLFLVGLGVVCVVLCGFLLVWAGFAAFLWFCEVLGWFQLVSLRLCVLCGFGLVSAGLTAFVWFCVVLGWSRLVLLRLCGSDIYIYIYIYIY